MPRGRYGLPGQSIIWPGFTDALAGLVVALVFLLVLFLLFEVVLSRQVTGQEQAIHNLRNQVERLAELLGRTQGRREELGSQLRESRKRRQALQGQIAELEQQLAQARQARKGLEKDLARAREQHQESAEKLASARRAREATEARLVKTRGKARASQTNLRALADYVKHLRQRLDRVRKALDRQREFTALAEARMEQLQQEARERQETVTRQRSRIEAMVARIRTELLRRVEVLKRYRSEFLGRLREVFADQPHIKIRGDRFVFQSQVLFPSGSAQLRSEGWNQLQRFVKVYQQLKDSIPEGISMVIMVEGHTDRRPIQTPKFHSNWELSIARALTVVQFLIAQGISPERLAATGYGEYHPRTPGNTPEQRRRNRRIELKITQF